MVTCPACNSAIHDEASARGICPQCGHLLDSAATPQQDPPAADIDATAYFDNPTIELPAPAAPPAPTAPTLLGERPDLAALKKRSLLAATQEQTAPDAGKKTAHPIDATQEHFSDKLRSVSIAPRKLSMNDRDAGEDRSIVKLIDHCYGRLSWKIRKDDRSGWWRN